jgi:Family of unknown function (DUF6178)
MSSRPELPPEARRILDLARRDRGAAEHSLAGLSLERQVALVCETPVARRGELLALLERPEQVIPELPEAELCFTVKAIGLHAAGWVLEHASAEQIQACFDLDTWSEHAPDPAQLDAWLEALADAGDEALVHAARTLDPELLVLWISEHCTIHLKPDDDPGWEPPSGARTVDGQFYVAPRGSDDALALPLRLFGLLFGEDYWFYFRILQAVTWESREENIEWALRWRAGRLQDLGFPTWEEAMAIYAHPRRSELEELPEAGPGVREWHLPVWMPRLPAAADSRHSLFRAAAELGEEDRRSILHGFLALANRVAVADRLPLGDAASIPQAFEKAAEFASRGLDHLSARHGLPAAEVLRRAPLDRLFRVGASLDRGGGSP